MSTPTFVPTGTPAPVRNNPGSAHPGRRRRDLRVDFWRGIAMFIIFMAHMPGNFWAWYIPARFGPSDGAEMFVFCSGFASAAAFGGTFLRSGWLVGCARVLHRVWQIYWAQIGLFMVTLAILWLGTELLPTDKDYIKGLNLYHFVNDPARGLVHLFTMTYVPNLFDILPMYMVVLALTPLVMMVHRFGGMPAVAVFVFGLWLAAWNGLDLPAEWWSDRVWFFNPFGWALIFFTGFAISAGWVKVPGPNPWLIVGCILFVAVLVPLSHWPIWKHHAFLQDIRNAWMKPGIMIGDFSTGISIGKTDHGLIRWLHILALGYLAHVALRPHIDKLRAVWLRPLIKVGQNALAVFLASIPLARIGGMVLDVIGRGYWQVALINLAGFALLIGIAYGSSYFKQQPWKRPPPSTVSETFPAGNTTPGRGTMAPAE